jgi:alkyl sulfatase BDS1-like metallo-beta-lactamase superfamily hydrolase|tara:strand:+ start:125 stop:1825 length:1701 start_codon:yes stop_codon:yes gene_type:complete
MKKIIILIIVLNLLSCEEAIEIIPDPVVESQKLKAHSEEFKKEIITVAEGVHVAIGYALANSIMIEGDGANIIVDTTGTLETATEIKNLFDKINSNPVAAIIYTHNHGDHIYGAKAFTLNSMPDIYAHKTTQKYINRVLGIVRPIISDRSSKMFGNGFPVSSIENNGIGPFLEIGRNSRTSGLLAPTVVFEDKLKVTIAGIKLELMHAPGETNDQILVWIPEKKILLPGDNFYKAFPNLYTIRGTPYRDLVGWVRSLDIMRYLKPDYLIPSHSRPLYGKDQIYKALTNYRDAIQFVHDQTIRMMNKNMTPDEISSQIKLPTHLQDSPFLEEFYGTPAWSARNVFSGYLGWFDGNPSNLNPIPPSEEAYKIIELAGGYDNLLEEAQNFYEEKNYQWCLQLTDYLIEANRTKEAIELRFSALNKLGELQSNPNARYFYLSSAKDLINRPQKTLLAKPTVEILQQYPINVLFETLKVNLIPEKSLDKDISILFNFIDTGKIFTLILRQGVLEVQPNLIEGFDIQVSSTEQVWKEIVVGLRSLPVALATGEIKVSGEQLALISFFNSFRE